MFTLFIVVCILITLSSLYTYYIQRGLLELMCCGASILPFLAIYSNIYYTSLLMSFLLGYCVLCLYLIYRQPIIKLKHLGVGFTLVLIGLSCAIRGLFPEYIITNISTYNILMVFLWISLLYSSVRWSSDILRDIINHTSLYNRSSIFIYARIKNIPEV